MLPPRTRPYANNRQRTSKAQTKSDTGQTLRTSTMRRAVRTDLRRLAYILKQGDGPDDPGNVATNDASTSSAMPRSHKKSIRLQPLFKIQIDWGRCAIKHQKPPKPRHETELDRTTAIANARNLRHDTLTTAVARANLSSKQILQGISHV